MLPFFSTGWTFEPNYFRKYATDLRKFLPIGSITGVDDCCEIGLWSLKGRCHDNQFLFIQSTQFFSSQWPMCNKRCVFSHDALDRGRYNTILEVIRRRFLLTTPIHRGTDISPREQTFLLDISLTLACHWIRQKVQVLVWTQAYKLTEQSTIINRWRRWLAGGLPTGFALHLVFILLLSYG